MNYYITWTPLLPFGWGVSYGENLVGFNTYEEAVSYAEFFAQHNGGEVRMYE